MKNKFFIILICFGFCYGSLNVKEIEQPMHKRIVVITGVTNGLGKALAEKFGQVGWKVAGCARSPEAIQMMQQKFGLDHMFSVVDISNKRAVEHWAKEVVTKLGSPDILINNAGIINERAPLWEISSEEFSKILDVNVLGTFHVLHAFIPSLIKSNKGIVINVSSSWGREAEENFSAYSASKFAVEGLTQSLAKELPGTITAVALDPGGGINTDMLKKSFGEEANEYPNPQNWAEIAVPYILSLDHKDNGQALTLP